MSLKRCVSNFPNMYDQITDRGGVMTMLVGEAAHRILGFGSLTPGPAPARTHKAVIDVSAHNSYIDYLPVLVEKLQTEAHNLKLQALQAFVADPDSVKKETFLRAGFKPIGQLGGELNTGSQEIDVTILEKTR